MILLIVPLLLCIQCGDDTTFFLVVFSSRAFHFWCVRFSMALSKRPVILDHDGGVDDLLALSLLCSDPSVDLLGVIVIDADCFIDPAYDVTLKLLALVNRPGNFFSFLQVS